MVKICKINQQIGELKLQGDSTLKYNGKRYLYNFLKEHGYKVPKMKEFNYEFYRGTEWLKSWFREIEVYSPVRRVVYVTINEYDEETDEKKCAEYSKYIDGVLNYQTKYGKCTIMNGKPYKKITV